MQKILTIVAFVVFTLPGCATVGRLNQTTEKLVRTTIVQSEQARCTVRTAPCLSDDQFKAVNLELNKIAVAGRTFTKLEIANVATIQDASTFLSTVATETAILSRTYPDGVIGNVLTELNTLQATITKLLHKLQPAQ